MHETAKLLHTSKRDKKGTREGKKGTREGKRGTREGKKGAREGKKGAAPFNFGLAGTLYKSYDFRIPWVYVAATVLGDTRTVSTIFLESPHSSDRLTVRLVSDGRNTHSSPLDISHIFTSPVVYLTMNKTKTINLHSACLRQRWNKIWR